ncbi:hypothetical protein [Calidifontibacillus oryziterrae]|uniref:hypothetical protein n=1 Tax=Calidifontibacillus oryziterrae TaxID=1191699 RepID=UPI0002D29423|nr:hypothetical protein [Calidifontibacillus oryziterrae]
MINQNDQITKLIDENKRLVEHVKELQETVGRWKRKANEQNPRPVFLRESHDQYSNHIIELIIEDLPGDAPLGELLNHLKFKVLPDHFPYKYYSAYTSKKAKGWVVKLYKTHKVDMSYLPRIDMNNLEAAKQLRSDILSYLRDSVKWINHFSANLDDHNRKIAEDIKEQLDSCHDSVERQSFNDYIGLGLDSTKEDPI